MAHTPDLTIALHRCFMFNHGDELTLFKLAAQLIEVSFKYLTLF